MRIFLAIPGTPNAAIASSLWRANLHAPLVEMGHDVVLFEQGVLPLYDLDPEAASTREPRARFTEAFLAALEAANARAPLDLVITYLCDSHLEPDAVTRVRERVAPIVNFFCNNVHQFHLVKRISPRFTRCLVPEREALDRYRRTGADPWFFPMAANPAVYHPVDVPLRYDATFAGQRYGERTAHVAALLDAGVKVHAFGQGWPPEDAPNPASASAKGPLGAAVTLAGAALHGRLPWRAFADYRALNGMRARHADALHSAVDDDTYVALFSASRINMGFLVLGDTHRTLTPLRQVRLREFEATMAGGFYITGYLDELGEHYVIGSEVETYRSRDELVDKCRYYLAHDAAREAIRRAGHARARRDHTWTRRFAMLFAALRSRGVE